MQTYIVRVYRACPSDDGSVSGVFEDIESGQKNSFHSINDLQSLLAHSIMGGQIEISNLTMQEVNTHKKIAVIGL